MRFAVDDYFDCVLFVHAGDYAPSNQIQQLLKPSRMIVRTSCNDALDYKASAYSWKRLLTIARNPFENQPQLYQRIFFAGMKPKAPHFQPFAPNTAMRFRVIPCRKSEDRETKIDDRGSKTAHRTEIIDSLRVFCALCGRQTSILDRYFSAVNFLQGER